MAESSANPNRKFTFASGCTLEIHHDDITSMQVDAIVNAANKYLRHGGGVAQAISLRGGPIIQDESSAWIEKYGPIDCDHPAHTSGGKLPCKTVIHAVGPAWGEGEEHDKLARAITSALTLADDLKMKSISFPAISTGIYGFPVNEAAEVFIHSMHDFLSAYKGVNLQRVLIVLFGKPTVDAFVHAFDDFGFDEGKG